MHDCKDGSGLQFIKFDIYNSFVPEVQNRLFNRCRSLHRVLLRPGNQTSAGIDGRNYKKVTGAWYTVFNHVTRLTQWQCKFLDLNTRENVSEIKKS